MVVSQTFDRSQTVDLEAVSVLQGISQEVHRHGIYRSTPSLTNRLLRLCLSGLMYGPEVELALCAQILLAD